MRVRLLRTSAALLTGAVVAGGAVAWMLWPTTPPLPVVSRFPFVLPEGQGLSAAGGHVVALSPDGRRLVYVANERLYLRNMHELTSATIAGTEQSNPAEPVFSPDGQWVAFYSGGALKKVPVMGGTPELLSAAENPFGASWEDGRILLGQRTPPGIVEIPASGGAAKPLVTLNEKAGEQARSPQLVAGGRSVLFTLRVGEAEWDDSSIVLHDLATGQRKVLVQAGTDARVLPTGHLVYTHAATIFAVPFDETRLTINGDPVPVQQGIFQSQRTGASQAAWSASGTFVIAQGMRRFISTFCLDEPAKPTGAYGTASSELRGAVIGVSPVAGGYARRGDDLFGRRLGLGRRLELRGLGRGPHAGHTGPSVEDGPGNFPGVDP